jgi:ParB family chromosome partitioning protein
LAIQFESIPTGELTPHPANLQIYGENQYVGDLVTSIREWGILHPIIIDQDKQIIDGVRRWQAAKTLELETVPCKFKEFENEDLAISAILTYNRYRQKTPRQVFNESRELKRIETEKAQIRMREGVPISAEGLKADVRDTVSRFFEMGHTKFGELEAVFEAENVYPDIAEKVANGTLSAHKGFTRIRNTIQKQKAEEEKRAKISEEISKVKRDSLREKLEEKYLSEESNLSKTSVEDIKTEIKKELGFNVDPAPPEQWKEIKDNLLKIVNMYKGHSSFREWISEDRKFLQTLTWMDVGKKITHLQRLELTKERFVSYEEADAYAESLGGYCDGLHKIGKKAVWILLVKPESTPPDEDNEQETG